MNQVICRGRLGRDPQIRATSKGTSVANFSVACDREYNGQKLTDWINVVAWGRTAEAVGNFLKQGDDVFVSGRLGTRKYTAKDGQIRYITEVTADFIGKSIIPAARVSDLNSFMQFGTVSQEETPAQPEVTNTVANEPIPF
ncbi:single-strand DNA-binding protein [Dialister histaminiformans]|uniref:Single-stranded DNA-binding protein n=1 Tax=Allisonella histaminiformans TaxID=209880 RepID=A0A1G5VI29_9FIRM|nr:single-stranded DNA-binding protein [Allisonella histaminiformans]SDA45414.1 single-strand DNA-binding protein [Allisonella histaminiformans]